MSERLLKCLAADPMDKVINIESEVQDPVSKSLDAQHFGIIQNCESFSMEPFGLATMRVALQGTRSCVIMRSTELAQFIQGEEKLEGMATVERVSAFARRMTGEMVKNYLAARFSLWHVTLGPGDLLFVPLGAFMAEATFNKQDIIGFKQSFFLSDASAHASYQWLSAQSQPTCNIAALILSKLGSAGAEVPALDDAQAGAQRRRRPLPPRPAMPKRSGRRLRPRRPGQRSVRKRRRSCERT